MERLVGRRTALALLGMPAALSLGTVLTGCSKNAQDSAPAISATELTADVKDTGSRKSPSLMPSQIKRQRTHSLTSPLACFRAPIPQTSRQTCLSLPSRRSLP